MPSTSPKQHKLMEAVAHGWKKPGGGGPSEAVGKEFVAADKAAGKYFRGGVVAGKSEHHNAAYAQGGGVLERSRDFTKDFKEKPNTDFLETKDRFTDRNAKDRVAGAPESQESQERWVKPAGKGQTDRDDKGDSKVLPPVMPRAAGKESRVEGR